MKREHLEAIVQNYLSVEDPWALRFCGADAFSAIVAATAKILAYENQPVINREPGDKTMAAAESALAEQWRHATGEVIKP